MNGSKRVLVESEEGGNVVLFLLYMSSNGDYVRCWRC